MGPKDLWPHKSSIQEGKAQWKKDPSFPPHRLKGRHPLPKKFHLGLPFYGLAQSSWGTMSARSLDILHLPVPTSATLETSGKSETLTSLEDIFVLPYPQFSLLSGLIFLRDISTPE